MSGLSYRGKMAARAAGFVAFFAVSLWLFVRPSTGGLDGWLSPDLWVLLVAWVVVSVVLAVLARARRPRVAPVTALQGPRVPMADGPGVETRIVRVLGDNVRVMFWRNPDGGVGHDFLDAVQDSDRAGGDYAARMRLTREQIQEGSDPWIPELSQYADHAIERAMPSDGSSVEGQ